MKKIRAGRNRSVVIEENEIPKLKHCIIGKDDIHDGLDFYNKVINADLFEVLSFLPNEFADLIIVDPPYNLDKNFNGFKFNSMNAEKYEEYVESWLSILCKKLKPSGSLYLCGDWKCTSSLQRVLERHLYVLNRITWQREKGRGAMNNWKNSMEDLWFAVKNPKDYFFNVEAVKMKRKVIAPYRENGVAKDWSETDEGNFRLTYPSNFWDDISVPFWSMPENTNHPTQKPEKLIAKLILASSKAGDLVFDPFLGSGTTGVVAKKLGRNFCGVEINEEYCFYAAKRLNMADEDKEIQGYSDNVFWERNTLALQKKINKKHSAKPIQSTNLFGDEE